jgi:hypothetical protein
MSEAWCLSRWFLAGDHGQSLMRTFFWHAVRNAPTLDITLCDLCLGLLRAGLTGGLGSPSVPCHFATLRQLFDGLFLADVGHANSGSQRL